MYLRTVDKSAETEDERDELAGARLCALVNRAYDRRLAERGLSGHAHDENEPTPDELDQIESEDAT